MKTKNIIFIAAAMLALVSCSDEASDMEPQQPEDMTMRFSASMTDTRGDIYNTVDDISSFAMFINSADDKSSLYENIVFTRNNANEFTSPGAVWHADKRYYDIIAYAPYNAEGKKFMLSQPARPTDSNSGTDLIKADLLNYEPADHFDTDNKFRHNLSFFHEMSKLRLTFIINKEGLTANPISDVSFSKMSTDCNIDLEDSIHVAHTIDNPVTIYPRNVKAGYVEGSTTQYKSVFDILLPPQKKLAFTIRFSVNGYEWEYYYNNWITLIRSIAENVNITVDGSAVTTRGNAEPVELSDDDITSEAF